MSLQFPNVPALPGVPPLVRQVGATINAIVPVVGSLVGTILGQSTQSQNIWGVFDSAGNKVLTPDSIREFDARAEWRISTYPIQQGGFAAYNKVALPPEFSIQMVMGGSVDARQAFEAQVDAVAQSITLYQIVTPEQTYSSVNVSRVEKTRKGAAGAFFLMIDLFFMQIIQVTGNYSTTQNAAQPSALPNASQGTVLPGAINPNDQVAQALTTVGIY